MCPPLESPRLEVTIFLAVPPGEYTARCRQNLLLLSSRSDARGWVRCKVRWVFVVYSFSVGAGASPRPRIKASLRPEIKPLTNRRFGTMLYLQSKIGELDVSG